MPCLPSRCQREGPLGKAKGPPRSSCKVQPSSGGCHLISERRRGWEALRPCGQLNPPISQRERGGLGRMGLTDPERRGAWLWIPCLTCRRRARDCGATIPKPDSYPKLEHFSVGFRSGLGGDGKKPKRTKSPRLRLAFWSLVWRPKLFRKKCVLPESWQEVHVPHSFQQKGTQGNSCLRVQG